MDGLNGTTLRQIERTNRYDDPTRAVIPEKLVLECLNRGSGIPSPRLRGEVGGGPSRKMMRRMGSRFHGNDIFFMDGLIPSPPGFLRP